MTSSSGGTSPSVLRVLVVEGDRHLRSLLRWVLDDDGRFRVVGEAADARTAVSWTRPFDLALVDLQLSGLDGSGVISSLHERTPAPVVVVLSVSGVPYLRYAARAQGADGFVVRPDDLDDIGDRLRDLARLAAVSPGPEPATG
jgi:DNA-binding NarL/FixJ family response regulator